MGGVRVWFDRRRREGGGEGGESVWEKEGERRRHLLVIRCTYTVMARHISTSRIYMY